MSSLQAACLRHWSASSSRFMQIMSAYNRFSFVPDIFRTCSRPKWIATGKPQLMPMVHAAAKSELARHHSVCRCSSSPGFVRTTRTGVSWSVRQVAEVVVAMSCGLPRWSHRCLLVLCTCRATQRLRSSRLFLPGGACSIGPFLALLLGPQHAGVRKHAWYISCRSL